MSESDILDLEHLNQQTFGSRSFLVEILTLFSSQAFELGGQLSGGGEPAQWRAVAHRLKGAALGVGAHQVARAAALAEQVADPASEEARNVLALLDSALSGVQAAISKELQRG